MDTQLHPLVLSMENISGEEVTLTIEPTDDFQTFLEKAKNLLGFMVDLNSITRNQPVSLTDNIYQYLLSSEHNITDVELAPQSFEQMLDSAIGANGPNANDLVYILDDGTQINASQIQFDNEDDPVDLTVENIPFVKYVVDDFDYADENVNEENTKKYNIVASPVHTWSSSNTESSFINSLPFKLVCNNSSGFETQFTKYLEKRAKTYTTLNPVVVKNKSPKTLIKDNYNSLEVNKNNTNVAANENITVFSREDVLNMFKDSPVASVPIENFPEKRRHVRKTDPSKPVFKRNDKIQPTPYIDVDGTLINQSESQNCFICTKFVENNMEKMYLFDNEDQKLHRDSALRKQMTQLKIICAQCLSYHFKPCTTRSPNQSLNQDEYLVIRNNQQYIFQKTNNISLVKTHPPSGNFVNLGEAKAIIDKIESEVLKGQDKEFVKVEIGSDGQIINKSVEKSLNDDDKEDNAKELSSDVEIIDTAEAEIDDNMIENLEEADEHVKEFLGKYQTVKNDELKCRFCERLFKDLSEVIEHGGDHKQDTEDGEVYPCPLCDYGYANFKWLKGHLKAAHEVANTSEKVSSEAPKTPQNVANEDDDSCEMIIKGSPKSSPVAGRTRNSSKKKDSPGEKQDSKEEQKQCPPEESNVGKNITENGSLIIKTEVKQETLDISDEEAIWIVQTAEDEELNEEQLRDLLEKAKGKEPTDATQTIKHHCLNCRKVFFSKELLETHSQGCAKGRGRESNADPQGDAGSAAPDGCLKSKKKEPSSDPPIVTCHYCNESFTSKVRLKFHMQFHEANNASLVSGEYSCRECRGDCVFATESELFDHVHFQHSKQKRWQCHVTGCGKTFYLRANLTKHGRTHTDTRRYVCPTCGKRFLDKQTLDEHSVTHLQIKPFQCHVCMKQLTRRSRLRMHLRAHNEEPSVRRVHACALCKRAFKDSEAAVEHARTSTACIEMTAVVKKEKEDIHLSLSPSSGLVKSPSKEDEAANLSEKNIRYQVEPTDDELKTLSDEAKRLIRIVEIEKAFRCEYCEDVFYLEEGLNEHRQVHKGVKNPFTCHICKVSFATYSRCTTHKTTHGYYKRPLGSQDAGILGYGGFPVAKHFLCEDCGRSYLHWTYLQVHRRMKHANDNYVYECTVCSITFPNSWSLAYHKKKCHGKDGQEEPTKKPAKEDYRIPCRDCDEVLPNKTALYKHRKNKHCHGNDIISETKPDMAGGFYCLWCSARYNSRAALETHAKIHLRSVPRSPARTQCDLCGLSAYRTSLSNPARTPCPRCARRVRVRTDLRRRDHAHTVVVIEVPGLNPTHAEVMAAINNNDICTDKIMDVNKISFAKGTSSVRPCSERALSILSGLQRPVPWNMPEQASTPSQSNAMEDMWRARSVVASHVRLPTILQRGYTLSRLTEGKEAADTKIEQLMRNPNENMTTLQKDPVSMN